jgi:hypothetical protein
MGTGSPGCDEGRKYSRQDRLQRFFRFCGVGWGPPQDRVLAPRLLAARHALSGLGASPCRLADARSGHPCPPLARCWIVLGIPAFTSPATPLDWHGLTPREPAFRACGRHRSPPARAGGTAGRWAIPASGSPENRSPPKRPIRDHHQTTDAWKPSRRLGASPCRLADARSGFTCPAARGEPAFRACGRSRSPPARAGGTAGRWAIPASGSRENRSQPKRPIRDHHQETPGGFRCSPVGRRAVGLSRPPEAGRTVPNQNAQSVITTKKPLVAFDVPRWDGGPLGHPGPRNPGEPFPTKTPKP